MPRRKKKTKKRQRGGVRFSEIITVENRDRFVGQEIELVSLIPRWKSAEWEAGIRISDLINKPGFIQQTTGTPTAAHYEHTEPGILIVYYPEYNQNVVLKIPQNLQDLGNDLVKDWGPIDDKTFVDDLDVYLNYTYYVRLRRKRGPDLFTAFLNS